MGTKIYEYRVLNFINLKPLVSIVYFTFIYLLNIIVQLEPDIKSKYLQWLRDLVFDYLDKKKLTEQNKVSNCLNQLIEK